MTKKQKLLEILRQFPNDPDALKALAKENLKQFEKTLNDVQQSHEKNIQSLIASHSAELAKRDKEAIERHKEALKAISEAKEAVLNIESGSVSPEKVRKIISDAEKRLETKYEHRLDEHGKRIERISEFAVGAPNRSIYVGGTIVSGRYSDVNLIAGTGVTITTADNETTAQAGVTISASGGSGFTVLNTSSTVNGNNASFVFATASAKPSFVVSDGVWYTATDSNGNTQWSWNSGTLTVTMTIPPTTSIYAIV